MKFYILCPPNHKISPTPLHGYSLCCIPFRGPFWQCGWCLSSECTGIHKPLFSLVWPGSIPS